MRLTFIIAAAAAGLAFASPSQAQGVFDMGQLTGTVSQDHVTQSEAARAEGREYSEDSDARASAQARANCKRLPEFRRKHGARDRRVIEFAALCRRAGY